MNDKAIEFESTKISVTKTITRMKEAKLNVTKYEEIYTKIINDCNKDNKTIPDSITNSNTNFATDYLTANYSKAIKELELLSLELSKYEIYVRVSSFSSYLKLFINKPNKTPEDFETYRDSLTDILNKLVKSSTLDYDVEGNIIEEMYEIAYYFIKEELKYLGYSPVLNSLSNNQIHINYLDREITKELEKIDLKDSKYSSLLIKKKQIDSIGFNTNYVTEDFLRLLTLYDLKHQNITSLINTLLDKINQNFDELKENDTLRELTKNKKTKNKSIRYDISKNLALLISSLSITAGLVLGGIKFAKITGRQYNNKITTYSLADGIEENTEYNDNVRNKTIIYEISPYEKKDNGYSRSINTYNVTNIGDIPLEEYLDIDLESLGIKSETTTEKVNELNLDDLYEETIRYIEKTEVDKNDYQIEVNTFIAIAIGILVLCLEALKEVIFIETYFSDGEAISWYNAIKDILNDIKLIKNEKISEKEKEAYLAMITEKSKKLLLENEEITNKLLEYYEIIKDKNEYQYEVEKIERAIKRIKKQPDYSHIALSGIPIP